MSSKTLRFIFVAVLLSGCVTASNVRQQDRVTILLTDGAKIKAQVTEISNSTISFEAIDKKKAFDYGENLPIERVRGIRMQNGDVLTVEEYDAFRRGEVVKTSKKKSRSKISRRGGRSSKEADFHYEEIKDKPIAEMTDNEFRFFMMMKERELAAQNESAPENRSEAWEIARTKPGRDLDELAESIIEAGVAPNYLSYLQKKSRLERLSSFERRVVNLIERHPEWQGQIEDLTYLNRTAKKALSRAYLYNPEELMAELDLSFNPDLDMDYVDLMQQLHRQFGDEVKARDFRMLVDVLGRSGARAVKEILQNYSTWEYVVNLDSSLARR